MLEGSKYIPREIQERYEIRGQVGRPMQWESYVAVERRTGRTVLLRFDRETPVDPTIRGRLTDSYLHVRRLRHLALPEIVKFGLPPRGGFYIAHEFSPGVSLRSYGGNIEWGLIVDVMAQILPALQLLHLNGVVHQRISPDKILVEGLGPAHRIRLTDVGPSSHEDGRRWAPWSVQAPEVAKGDTFDGRADLYSLAIAIHEAIVGTPPFSDATAERAARTGEYRDVPPMRAFRKDCPPILEELLMRMGSHDPEARPRSALALAHELPRTGLLRGATPTLDTKTVIDATRWRLCEDRVKSVLNQIPQEITDAEVTCDPGLETVADEVQARLGLRRGSDRGQMANRAHERAQSNAIGKDDTRAEAAIKPINVAIRNSGNSRKDSLEESDNIEVAARAGPSTPATNTWIRNLIKEPLSRERRIGLMDWADATGVTSENELCHLLIRHTEIADNGLSANWEKIERQVAASNIRHLRRTSAAKGVNRGFDRVLPEMNRLRRRALTRAAACIGKWSIRARKQLPKEKSDLRLLYTVAAAHEACGEMQRAARKYKEAAFHAEDNPGYASALFHLRSNIITMIHGIQDADLGLESAEKPTQDPLTVARRVFAKQVIKLSRKAWDAVRQGRVESASCMTKELLELLEREEEEIDRSHGPPKNTRARSHLESVRAELQLFQLRVFYEFWQESELIPNVQLYLRKWTGRTRPTNLIRAELMLFALHVRLNAHRTGGRAAGRAARIARNSGDTYGARLAMRGIASSAYGENRHDAARRWGEHGERGWRSADRAPTAIKADRAQAVFLHGMYEFEEAARLSLRAIRASRRMQPKVVIHELLLVAGLSMLGLSRFASATRLLKRSVDHADRDNMQEALTRSLYALVEASFYVGDLSASIECAERWHSLAEEKDPAGSEEISAFCTVHQELGRLAAASRVMNLTRSKPGPRPSLQLTVDAVHEEARGGRRAVERLDTLVERTISRVLWANPETEGFGTYRVEEISAVLERRGCRTTAIRLCTVFTARFLVLGWRERASVLAHMRARMRKRIRRLFDHHADRHLRTLLLDRLAQSCTHVLKKIDNAASSLEFAHQEEQVGRTGDAAVTPIGHEFEGRALSAIQQFARLGCGLRSAMVIFIKGSVHYCAARTQADFCWSWRKMSEGEFDSSQAGAWPVIVWRSARGLPLTAATSECGTVCVLLESNDVPEERVEVRLMKSDLAALIARSLASQTTDPALESGMHRRARGTEASLPLLEARRIPIEGSFLVVHSEEMRAVLSMIERFASRGVPIVLCGESGTGKELLAQWGHKKSKFAQGPLVPVDCPSLSASVIESELFGHVRGAFSGAVGNREGLLVNADKGTLFLDEVGDLATGAQAKLLRVLSVKQIRPVGGNQPRSIKFYLIAATNVDLSQSVQTGEFRLDLYHRLGVPVRVPPLRERRGDIVPLWEYFLEEQGERIGVTDSETRDLLESHEWPGNVRELANLAQVASVLSDGAPITASLLRGLLTEHTNVASKLIGTGSFDRRNPRLSEGLRLVRSLGRVTRREYASSMGISPRSALRDLNQLVELGFALRVGRGRSVRYVLSETSSET